MRVRASFSSLLLILVAIFFHSEKLLAASTVPPGACLYALDPTAADAFQIAGPQSVYAACALGRSLELTPPLTPARSSTGARHFRTALEIVKSRALIIGPLRQRDDVGR